MATVYDAGNIPQLVAENIVTTGNTVTDVSPQITSEFLGPLITDIQPQTQTIGAALLNVDLIDPTWVIYRSGLCTRDPDGLLPQVDVEYPPGTDVWWRLAYVSITNDLNSANLTMTFQHRIVSYLTHDWGPLAWKNLGGQGTTRAQFIKRMFSRIPKSLPKGVAGPGGTDIIFESPELNVVQPIAGTGQAGQVVTIDQSSAASQTAAQQAAAQKAAGITDASKVLVKGSPVTATQVSVINALLEVGQSLGAPTPALEAIIYAGMGETSLGADASAYVPNRAATPYSPQGFWGVLQGAVSYWPDPHDTAGMATAFFTGKGPQGQGDFQVGAINRVKAGTTNPAEIAIRTEVPSIWPVDDYAREFSGGQAQGLAEAKAIVQAAGLGGLVGGAGAPGAATAASDIADLSRGTPDLPDEDSWTCGQRLASEVNWMLFTSPYEGGRWGNYVYLIDGPTLVAQQPALYLELNDAGTDWTLKNGQGGAATMSNKPRADGGAMGLTGSTDNTAFVFQETLPVKGKVQRKSTIRMPSSPSQVKFNCFAGVFEFNAGQVVIFHNTGGLDGRWIITDATQNSLSDLYVQLTLGPPTYPYPEPQSTATAAAAAGGAAAASAAAGVAASGAAAGYVYPLPKSGLSSSRIDMGVDFGGSGPLLALGNGKILAPTSNSNGGWPGGGFILLQLADGIYAGKFVYYAEDVTTSVQPGQTVKAGDTIGTLHGAIEIGWASGVNDQPYAEALGENGQATGQSSDNGGVLTQIGDNFNKLLIALGGPGGDRNASGQGPPSLGPGLPAGWPTLTGTVKNTGITTISPGNGLPGGTVGSTPSGLAAPTQGIASGIAKTLGGIFGSVFDRNSK